MEILANIDVGDLDRAVEFYTEALDLRPGRRFGAAGVELLGGSAKIYLLTKPAGSPAYAGEGSPQRSYQRHWTPVHLDFVVDDAEAAVRRACAGGARLERALTEHDWGRIAVLSDPFGHGFCIIQFSARGYDAIAT